MVSVGADHVMWLWHAGKFNNVLQFCVEGLRGLRAACMRAKQKHNNVCVSSQYIEMQMRDPLWWIPDNKTCRKNRSDTVCSFIVCSMTKLVCTCHSKSACLCLRERDKKTWSERERDPHQSERCAAQDGPDIPFQAEWGTPASGQKHTAG